MKTVKTFILLILTFLSQITFAQCWTQIAAGGNHSVAIKSDGTLWAWGRNQYGQLGDGTTVNKNVPTQIGTDTDWSSIYVSFATSVALKTDGSLWAWGDNTFGQVGDGNHGTFLFNPFPTRVGTDTDWIIMVASANQTFATKSDGTLWGWGEGEYLGNGNLVDHYTPFQIGTDTNWATIVTSEFSNSLALKVDNSIWGWGLNNNGALGTGAMTTPIPIPTQIGNSTNDWSKISAGTDGNASTVSLLIKTDGSLWGMGSNQFGTVGVGSSFLNVLVPTQIGSETDWNYVNVGGGTTFSLKNNGSLWGWGLNNLGQLGDGTLETKYTPVAIGQSLLWKKISMTNGHVLALTSDDTLYTWGWNNYGQLGDGTFTNKSIPSLIGSSCSLIINVFDLIESFRLYPNPVQSSATVTYIAKENTMVVIEIDNSLGQQIYSNKHLSTVGKNQQTINLTSYSAGIYFVTLKSQNESNTIKLIKN